MKWINLKAELKPNKLFSDVEDFDDCVGVFIPYENVSKVTKKETRKEKIDDMIKAIQEIVGSSYEVDFDCELPNAGYNFVII